MSENTFVRGNITEKTGGVSRVFAKGDIIMNSNGAIKYSAESYTYGDPEEPPVRKLKYFEEGWWSSDREGNKRITAAFLGDKVYFHLKTKNIPDGDDVLMRLYEDDNNEPEQPKEAGKKDQDDFIKLQNTATHIETTSWTVKENRILGIIVFSAMENYINDEVDKQIEVYYRCSYMGENVEMPRKPSDYLKIKAMPKIIFVNGQWRIADRIPFEQGKNFGPTRPKKPYWYDGNKMVENASIYFQLDEIFISEGKKIAISELEAKNFILYYDGSSSWGGDQSGKDRFKDGQNFAQDNYNEIIKGLGNQPIYLISHSEGGAYAAGIADYLFNKGHKIGEHILLSPDEADEFEINPEIPSYQLTYMFFSSIYNPVGAVTKEIKFKTWKNYYAVVDWVVNEYKIKGITKMGIVKDDLLNWGTVHGSTNDANVFNQIKDLKEVRTFDVIGEHKKEFYSGKSQTEVSNATKFYRVDDEYIITNCPPIIEIK